MKGKLALRKLGRALAAALLFSALSIPAPGGAAGYDVYACRLPNGAPAPAFGWTTTRSTIGGAMASIRCPGGAMTLAPLNKVHELGWRYGFEFTAPPGTAIAGVARHVEGDVGHVNQGPPPWSWEAGEYGAKVATPDQEIAIRIVCGNCGPFSDDWGYRLDGLFSRIILGLECGPYGSQPCQANGAHLEVRRVAVTLEDRRAPQVVHSAGSLLAPGPRVGLQGLTLKLRDIGGGLLKSRIEVDGQRLSEAVIDDNLGRCKPPFVVPVPCKLAATHELQIDTTRLADGVHDVTVRVFDATGVNAAIFGPIRVNVDNLRDPPSRDVARVVCPPTDGKLLRRANRRLVRFGGSITLMGRARRAAAVPRGSRVVIIDDSGRRLGPTSARLGRHGRFRVRLRPSASGAVRAALVSPSGAVLRCASRLAVRVRAGVRFRVSPLRLHNGDTLTMRGSLRGLSVPAGGKSVVIQARARGVPVWTTVTRVRSDASGRFRFTYRFRRTFDRTTYEFRAVAPRQRGYPYVRGASRTRRATVSP